MLALSMRQVAHRYDWIPFQERRILICHTPLRFFAQENSSPKANHAWIVIIVHHFSILILHSWWEIGFLVSQSVFWSTWSNRTFLIQNYDAYLVLLNKIMMGSDIFVEKNDVSWPTGQILAFFYLTAIYKFLNNLINIVLI